MNDDELTRTLREAMAARTAADRPSGELMHALATTRVRGQRPYLVPFSAAAVVALTAGGVLVSQVGGGGLPAGSDSTTTPAAPSAAAPASAVPSAAPATSAAPVAVPVTSAAPATSAAPVAPIASLAATPSASPAPTTEATPNVTAPATTPATPPVAALPTDDGALLAAAATYSVTSVFVPDAAHPTTGRTTHVETLQHDGTKSFYAGAEGLDWDQLAALPKDLTAFAATVKSPGHPPNPVEKGLQELYLEGPIPYDVRKEVLAVMETAPGATTTHSADHLGRTATKVSVTTDKLVDDYYFDPVSCRLLESGVTFSAGWKADYVAHAAVGSDPISTFTDGYTSYSDWVITPKSS